MSYVFPTWGFQDYNIKLITFIYFSKILWGLTAVCLIQFFLSLIFKHFVVPVGFACGVTTFSVIFYKWKYIDFVSYNECSVALSNYMQEAVHFFDKSDWINISYIFAFLLFSHFIFQKIKG
jgi:hypothetical protein